jgi:hypothetical protein
MYVHVLKSNGGWLILLLPPFNHALILLQATSTCRQPRAPSTMNSRCLRCHATQQALLLVFGIHMKTNFGSTSDSPNGGGSIFLPASGVPVYLTAAHITRWSRVVKL